MSPPPSRGRLGPGPPLLGDPDLRPGGVEAVPVP